LFSTATCQINNTTVSINTQDVLPSILRMNNSRELYRFNSTTPSLPDQSYYNYDDAQFSNNNPISAYNTASFDLDQVPRGAFPALVTLGHFGVIGSVAGGTYPITAGNAIYLGAGSVSSGTQANYLGTGSTVAFSSEYWIVNLQAVITEPLFLSPWIWGNPEFNSQGLLGINNMSYTLTIDATAKRLLSVVPQANVTMNANVTSTTSNSGLPQLGTQLINDGTNNTGGTTLIAGNSNAFTFTAPTGVTSIGIIQPQTAPVILYRFLSTQPSDLIQTKNIVPYHDYPRYLSSQFNNVNLGAGVATNLTSSNLQINQIPDLFLITVRKTLATQTAFDSMSQLVINSITINLNNQSGLLSSASQYDLWRLSERNGSTQSFNEFCGQQYVVNNGTQFDGLVPTTGSLLVLNPAYDLSLPDYITCGSLGNYNFQFIVNVTNQSGATIPNVEICIVTVNSGIFTTQQGVSAVYTGILTKEMVLGAKSGHQASAMTSLEVARMVGGKKMMPLSAYKGMMKACGMRRMGGVDGSQSSGGVMGSQSSGGMRAKKYC
jgi:hypothetical protein